MNVDCCFYSLHIVQLVNEGVSDHPLLATTILQIKNFLERLER